MNGQHNEGEKLRLDLLPPGALQAVAEVLTAGAQKHGEEGGRPGWHEGRSFASHYGAAQRHLTTYWQGEDLDREDGFHHLAAAVANLLILFDLDARFAGSEWDDRPEPPADRTVAK